MFGKAPSELLSVSDDAWGAWMINRAVWAVGAFITGKLHERDKKGKPRWTVEQILSGQAGVQPVKRNAAARAQMMFGNLMGDRR